FGQMRLALIIRLTIGKAYYENTFRVFHHSLFKRFFLGIYQNNLNKRLAILKKAFIIIRVRAFINHQTRC
ncbi:hypothetical protein ABMX89_11870, partial [Lacticaseibacillus rhamnosus]|nr:hypothetical protein [Lacticaseibacillus rhamnosus]